MPREKFLINSEFMELVRICVITRCSYIEAVKVFKRAGFQISSKTFQRGKAELERTRKERMSQIIDTLSEYAANTIDTSNAVDHELWVINKTSKNIWQRLKALEMLMKNCGGKSSNFDAGPVLEKIAKRLESAKIKEEIKKEGSTDVVTDSVKTMDNDKHGVEENT